MSACRQGLAEVDRIEPWHPGAWWDCASQMALIYEDKTRVLRRCFFDVQNEVGLGRQEEDYHRACKLWLGENQIPFTSKHPHPLLLDRQVAHTLYPDLVTWDAITVELKAVMRSLRSTESVQLFDYLKCRKDRLGLLVNMGLDRVHVQRMVCEFPETTLEEDWSYWSGRISGRVRDVGIAVRDALRAIYREHQTGYGEEVIAKLIQFALQSRRLAFTVAPVSKAYYHGIELHESPLECIVIEDCMLLAFTALFDSNEFNVHRGKSYLKALNLDWGIAANFGKTKAELRGLGRAT
jgi:GxxExxY protein